MNLELKFKQINPSNLCMRPNICHFCNKNNSRYHHFITSRFGWIYCRDCCECADENLHNYCKRTKRITYGVFATFDIDFIDKIEGVYYSIIRSSGKIDHKWKVSMTLDDTFITYDEKTKDYFWEMTNGPLRRKVSIRSMRILNDNLEVDRILGEIEKYHKY